MYLESFDREAKKPNENRINPLINEVPLKLAFDCDIKLPSAIWNVFGRLQWWQNIGRQQEIRNKTIYRARKTAETQVCCENSRNFTIDKFTDE